MIEVAQKLKDFLDALVQDPDLQPDYDGNGKLVRTFCNYGAVRAAQFFDCHEFDLGGLMADGMYQIMASNADGKWKKVEGPDAAEHALAGGLAFAALPSTKLGEAHGHIATVYPAAMELSGFFRKAVPFVANIGKGDAEMKNWICKVSQAFPVAKGEPDYFTRG